MAAPERITAFVPMMQEMARRRMLLRVYFIFGWSVPRPRLRRARGGRQRRPIFDKIIYI
jgi:hypothetical protein